MELADAARKLIVVDRERNVLDFYERDRDEVKFEKVKRYPVSVGVQGHRTPRGAYTINTKVKDPDWQIPASQWAIDAGLTPGTIVPGGSPANPLKARWLGVTSPRDGVGIHGTAATDALGSPASHGCIRMDPADIVELYQQVPKGTPVVVI